MMKKKAWTKGDGMEISNILMRDGLSLEVLHKLSFESKLGINLKRIFIILIKKVFWKNCKKQVIGTMN